MDWVNSWAWKFASEVLSRAGIGDGTVELTSLELPSTDEVRFHFISKVWPGDQFGIAAKQDDFANAAILRLAGSSIAEIALNLVAVGLFDPHALVDAPEPDAAGIRWLDVSYWAG